MPATSPPPSLGPALDLLRSLRALDSALSGSARRMGARFGITATQRLVIRIVGQSPGTSAGAVSSVLHVHPSTLTPALQELVDRGLVRRSADPADRRRAVLWLTTRGARVDAASAAAVDGRIGAALARLPRGEVLRARRVIDAVAEALGGAEPARRGRRKMRRPRAPISPGGTASAQPSRGAAAAAVS